MQYETLKVTFQDPICTIQINRPEANNTINDRLVEEFVDILAKCREESAIVVLEGLPEVFCFGADFKSIKEAVLAGQQVEQDPNPLYKVWQDLATGPFVTIAHVRGKANAGGIGFLAACDIVLADETAVFSLSELLFGVMPACVLPFLIRRVGFQKAHYMTLMTQPVSVKTARDWGLVDAYEENSRNLLRKHLLRLRSLSKTAVKRYKTYMGKVYRQLTDLRETAVAANLEVFSDPANLEGIVHFVKTGQFPWQKDRG